MSVLRPRALSGCLLLLVTGAPAALAQFPSSVNYAPTPPPTATWPLFGDQTAGLSAPGSDLGDTGTGRGQVLADLVGIGPQGELTGPDGRLDWFQLNSNSPALPLDGGGGVFATPAVGDTSAPSALFAQAEDGTFVEITFQTVVGADAGYQLPYPGGSPWGASVADYDGDGFLDVFAACGGFNLASPNALLQAQGDGTFVNRSFDAGLTEVQGSRTGLWLDADRDGDLDLHVTNGHPEEATLWLSSPNTSAVDRYYENQGDGTFVERGAQAGLALNGTSFTATTADLDQDGFSDLVVSCFKQLNKVFYANGDGTFDFMMPDGGPLGFSLAAMIPDPAFPGALELPGIPGGLDGELPILPGRSMPVEAVDFNGDGWLDLLYLAWSFQIDDNGQPGAEGSAFGPFERSYLYLNKGDQDGDGRGDGLFREVAEETGIGLVAGTMGLRVGDLNGDGAPDVYAGAGGPQPEIHQEEDYTLINDPAAWPANYQADPDQPIAQAFYEVGALTGSYANLWMAHGVNLRLSDAGRFDVVIGNGGPAQFEQGQPNVYLQHSGNASGTHSTPLRVQLEDPGSPQPVGVSARVGLLRDGGGGAGQWLVRQRDSNHSFGSQSLGPVALFPGDDDQLFVQVRWPGNWRQGLLLWPIATQLNELTLTRPNTSVQLERTRLGGGVDRLSAEIQVENDEIGTLWIAHVAGIDPQSPESGPFTVTAIDPVALPLILTAGETWNIEADLPSLLPGMFVLRYVGLEGETLGEDAIWIDAPAPIAAQALSARAPERPVRATRPVRRTVALSASGARLSPLTWPLEPRELDLEGSGELEIGTDALLRWSAGEVRVELGARAGTWQFDGDRGQLYLDTPMSCCEGGIHPRTGEYLAPGERSWWLEFDLAEGCSPELDERAYDRLGWSR